MEFNTKNYDVVITPYYSRYEWGVFVVEYSNDSGCDGGFAGVLFYRNWRRVEEEGEVIPNGLLEELEDVLDLYRQQRIESGEEYLEE